MLYCMFIDCILIQNHTLYKIYEKDIGKEHEINKTFNNGNKHKGHVEINRVMNRTCYDNSCMEYTLQIKKMLGTLLVKLRNTDQSGISYYLYYREN